MEYMGVSSDGDFYLRANSAGFMPKLTNDQMKSLGEADGIIIWNTDVQCFVLQKDAKWHWMSNMGSIDTDIAPEAITGLWKQLQDFYMKNNRNEQMTIENVTEDPNQTVGAELVAPLGLRTNITLMLATADKGNVPVHIGLSGENWSCVPPITDAEMSAILPVSVANRLVYNVDKQMFFHLNNREWENFKPVVNAEEASSSDTAELASVGPGEVIDILQDILTAAEEIEKVIEGE